SGLDYWTVEPSYLISSENGVLHVKNTSGAPYPRAFLEIPDQDNIELGREYTVSFEVKSSEARSMIFWIAETSGAKTALNTRTDVTDEWQRVVRTFRFSTITPGVRLQFWLNAHQSEDEIETWIRKPKLEKGNKATD